MTTKRRSRGEGAYRPRGKNAWELRFDTGTDPKTGKRIARTVTFKGSERDARARLRELIGQAEKGALPEPNKATIADYVSERIGIWEVTGRKGKGGRNLGPISPKTAERYRELLANQIKPHIGALTLQKLKAADIERWHVTLRTDGRRDGKGGLSDRTILHAHRLLSQALDDAGRFNFVALNAATAQGAPGVSADEIQILAEDEIRAVVAGLRERTMYAPAVTALFTGLRRGELLALRWHWIDFNAKAIQVREALEQTKGSIRAKAPKTKNGIRDVTMPDIVMDALRDHRRHQLELRVALGLGKLPDDALLFPKLDGTHQSPRAFSAAWADTAASLDLAHITLHALRHTHASQLIAVGIDPVTIAKRLGHKDANVTLRIYAHLFDKRADKAADAINAALAGFRL